MTVLKNLCFNLYTFFHVQINDKKFQTTAADILFTLTMSGVDLTTYAWLQGGLSYNWS